MVDGGGNTGVREMMRGKGAATSKGVTTQVWHWGERGWVIGDRAWRTRGACSWNSTQP